MSRAAKVDFAKSSEKLIPDESSSVELIPVVGGKSAGGVTRADSGGRLSAIANATPNGDGDGMQRGSRRGTKEKNSKIYDISTQMFHACPYLLPRKF
eukprot:1340831-Amorphochlora_amoeboformis.AAC.2